ncbi:MAG TPA: hypothetical protein VGS19_16665 [Streptosporangiaceae bacterium]|nr:hypothetical protein [Streptosporangiaceae bacterium]
MRGGTALVLLAVLAGAGCSTGHSSGPATPQPRVTGSPMSPGATLAVTRGCPASIAPRLLPTWARAGFHPAAQSMPYVMGERGDIVAILWADPLRAPPLANRNNKILWVSRLAGQLAAPLRIRATLNGTGRTVTREVAGGPGPSIIDMPAAGCWSFGLSWSGHEDHLKLRYVAS